MGPVEAQAGSPLVVGADAGLRAALEQLARDARIAVVVGLPGTGKSLVIHQLAHLAHAGGRAVHLLQWDVARPPFEAHPAGARYPLADGVTHPMIRVAVGQWARAALVEWDRGHPGRDHLLIGEAPFVGGRLIELARPGDDAAEAVLSAPSCRFVLPVPSREVRAHMEAERDRRAREPVHPNEREDAPPHVLRDLWRSLTRVASALGLGAAASGGTWDPDLYRRVYEAVLRHRPVTVLPMDRVLPTRAFSVYAFATPRTDVVPTADEVARAIAEAESRHPDPATLERSVAEWWRLDPDYS